MTVMLQRTSIIHILFSIPTVGEAKTATYISTTETETPRCR